MMLQKSGKEATKKMPTTRRAKKGERLLATCEPIMSVYAMKHLAASLYGMMLTDPDGRIFQVVAVSVDEPARQIYGKFKESSRRNSSGMQTPGGCRRICTLLVCVCSL